MGLSSAMTTALTGLNAAEVQIDVSANNLANSQTVGFKASDVVYASQFLRTLSQGSQPSATTGGTNPRQLGLGVEVAEIAPDFTQGTVEVSSSTTDMAIQGEGFFIVEGGQGEPQYTRTGIFKPNAANELVSVTGNRLLGHGVDEYYQLQPTKLVPLTVPLGSAAAAQATRNVFLNGNLTPTGDVATISEVIDSVILGDSTIARPDIHTPGNPTQVNIVARPATTGTTVASAGTGTDFVPGDMYEYVFTFLSNEGQETGSSTTALPVTIDAAGHNPLLSDLPPSPLDGGTPKYDQLNIYRRKVGVPVGDPEENYRLVGSTTPGAASFEDPGAPPSTPLDTAELNGVYSYLVTFSGLGAQESRPSELLGPVTIVNGRIELKNLPPFPTGPDAPKYDTINIYRNLSSNVEQYYLVASVPPDQQTYIDSRSDADISDLTNPANRQINLDGPTITSGTLLTNVVRRDGLDYQPMFHVGTLKYTGRKGGNALMTKTMEITAETTVGEYLQFLTLASGIQTSLTGDVNPIRKSINKIPGESGMLAPGASITNDGRMRVVSNTGTANSVSIPSSAFQMNLPDGSTATPSFGFASVQEGIGQSVASDFIVYDSLGIPLNVRLTAVLESRDNTATTYRWYADCGDNDPPGANYRIAVGTGLVAFDGAGNLIHADNPNVNIDRADLPSVNPLVFALDFSQVSGFASDACKIAASRQDGSAVGTLTSYSIGEGGEIIGVFSNGMSRTLGQIRMVRFANPVGLDQRGENMYGIGFNSGLPVEGNPGDLGLGSIVAGAIELSNTDTGKNLVDLLLASTQYRANSRVISTSQTLLDELLNIRR